MQSRIRAAVVLSYVQVGLTATPINTRTIDITVMNGPAPEYDAENPYADVDFPVDYLFDSDDPEMIEKTGLATVYEAISRIFTKIMKMFANLITMIANLTQIGSYT